MGAVDSNVDANGAQGNMNKVEAVNSERGTVTSVSDRKNILSRFSFQKKRKLKKYCIWCGIPVLTLAIVILTLTQTIFKFRDPDITLSDVCFSGVTIDYSRPLSPSSVNASLSANMNVYNPNHYNFKFIDSTIHVVYHDVMVGRISMPGGELRAGKSCALQALVTVGSLKLGSSMGNLYLDFEKNQLPFAMSVNIPGRVNVAHIFKHNVVLEYHCDVVFWVGNSTLKDYHCWRKVHM